MFIANTGSNPSFNHMLQNGSYWNIIIIIILLCNWDMDSYDKMY